MPRRVWKPLRLREMTADERAVLTRLARARKTEFRVVERASILLAPSPSAFDFDTGLQRTTCVPKRPAGTSAGRRRTSPPRVSHCRSVAHQFNVNP
jgi:hypothetical protein